MSNILRICIVVLFFVTAEVSGQDVLNAVPAGQPEMDELLEAQERFIYEVKFGFFNLGTVTVYNAPDTLFEGRIHHHLVTHIESNPKIPFMGTEIDEFHSLYYIGDDGLPRTTKYWKDNLDEDEYEEIVYTFDREKNLVYYKEEDNTRDTLQLEEPATAGHVIFHWSRMFTGSGQSSKLPVYVTKVKGYIYMDHPTKTEMRNYEAFDEPVESYLSKGSTENIEGPFGFSGNFRSWFLTDDLRVPLEGRVKVFLGNVIIKLISYEKGVDV